MFIKQSDLFLGTSLDFVKSFMDISQMASHPAGDFLFHEKDPAQYFYILINGWVRLRIGKPGQVVYDARKNGEAFGWSSLIGRDAYSASAECVEPVKLLKTDREKLLEILAKDPANGFVFFQRLAATLGNRLLQSYRKISPARQEA